MATIVPEMIGRNGLAGNTLTNVAPGGDEFVNSGRVFVRVFNLSDDPITVIIATTQLVDGLPVQDRQIVIVNHLGLSFVRLIGPFTPSVYNDIDHKVQLTYSASEFVLISVLELPKR